MKELFEETYIKDIIDRNQIKNSEEVLEVLLDFVSLAVGSLTNPLKLSNRYASKKKINISNNTISKYLTYFEEAYVLYAAKRYDIKGQNIFLHHLNTISLILILEMQDWILDKLKKRILWKISFTMTC